MDEDKANLYSPEEDSDDILSLCDLPVHDREFESDSLRRPNSLSTQEFFEFIVDKGHENTPRRDDIIFCGKIIAREKEIVDPFDEDQGRYLFPLSSARYMRNDSRSKSLRLPSSKSPLPPATGSCRFLTGTGRKHKILIGLAKFPPKMELSDIKKRQSRRTPAPMFPLVAGGETAVAGGDGGGVREHRWGLLRPLRCSAHLASALARASWSCIPHV